MAQPCDGRAAKPMTEGSRGVRWILTGVGLLCLGAYGGWRWGGAVFPRIENRFGSPAPAERFATPELARKTLDALEAFRRDPERSEISLGALELESLLRYSAGGVIPAGVEPPRVELSSGRIRLTTRVAVAAFPPMPDVEQVVGVLPDTVPVEVDGSVMPFGASRAALIVHRVSASGVPLPRRLIPGLVTLAGRQERPGLPPDAVTVPLPGGLESVYILSDSLILVAARP